MSRTHRQERREPSNIVITHRGKRMQFSSLKRARQVLQTINDEATRYTGTSSSLKRNACGATLTYDA